MGAIKIDLFKDSQPFKYANLSNIGTIKALILLRSQLDKFWQVKQNYKYNESGDIQKFNEELDCLYLDLDELIKKANFTQEENDLLSLLMEKGIYNERLKNGEYELSDEEIMQIFGYKREFLDLSLNRMCVKMKQIHDDYWLYSILRYKQ